MAINEKQGQGHPGKERKTHLVISRSILSKLRENTETMRGEIQAMDRGGNSRGGMGADTARCSQGSVNRQ